MLNRSSAVYATIILPLLLAACSSEPEDAGAGSGASAGSGSGASAGASAGATSVSIDTSDEDGDASTTTIRTSDGTATLRSGASVPLDLPAGFTLYPGANVLNNSSFEQNGEKGALVMMESDETPEKLSEFYRKQAVAAGVELEMELTVNDGRIIGGQSPEGLIFSFQASDKDGKTTGQLMIGSGH